MKRQISVAHSIVGTSRGRPDTDFYSTPKEATLALLEREEFLGTVWEPACGKGAISEVIRKETDATVVSTDLHDYGYGHSGVDFLEYDWGGCDHIVTNPPYKLAQEFIEHALECVDGKVAMLLKLTFLEGIKRHKFFKRTPLRSVYVFSKRLQMFRNDEPRTGSGMICFAWYVWEHGYKGKPQIDWILL